MLNQGTARYWLSIISVCLLPVRLHAEPGIPTPAVEQLFTEIAALRQDINSLGKLVYEIHKTMGVPAKKELPVVGTVVFGGNPMLGNKSAKIGIVEFSEFECSYCRGYHEYIFPRIKSAYIDKGDVLYVFRDFPLDFHSKAVGAAVAASCLGEQMDYWDAHHQLFTNQERLGPELYKEIAGKANLDIGAFQKCMEKPDSKIEMEGDISYGDQLGIRATPSFLIGRVEGNKLENAKLITGAAPLEKFVKEIEDLLYSGTESSAEPAESGCEEDEEGCK
jgi:protein-disulfide isomerase